MNLPRAWIALAAILILTTAVFGAPADYPPLLRGAITAALLLAGVAAAWFAGVRVVTDADPQRRLAAAAAALLVAPFVLFALVPGAGPPRVQPVCDNELRFLLLAIDAMLVGAGLLVLKELLADTRGRLMAALGGAAATIACPLYVLFSLIQRTDYVAEELGWSWAASVTGTLRELTPFDALSTTALFFGGTLTWLAIILFARALASAGWLESRAAVLLQAIGALGLAFLVARGLAYPGLQAAFSHWVTIPGFVAGIPAVPWMPPCVIGVLLLRRLSAGDAAARVSAPARPAARSATT